MDRTECVVVGAGLVGLAIARRLARTGLEVVALEAAATIGTGISSRNSEVIHAGLYYTTGGLKARACVAGRKALYAYCRERGVDHRRIGKLIVATRDGHLEKLDAIHRQAIANGCDDARLLTANAAREMEPALRCVGALLSPSTGIIDSHGLMMALWGDAEAAGATFAFQSPIIGGRVERGGFVLDIGGPSLNPSPSQLACRYLINAAGLGAVPLAANLRDFPSAHLPRQYLAKGNYFAPSGVKAPFSHLIYPVPEDGGLGVHLTLDLAGQARFGPDVEWLESDDPAKIDYGVDPARGDGFHTAIRQYWPGLPEAGLVPAYSGIRPKLTGPGAPPADFLIQGPHQHGVPGLVNLFGIESPGLTSCLALADMTFAALG